MDARTVGTVVRFSPEKMQKVNLFESSRMFVDVYCLLAGQQQAVHTHAASDKVYHVLEGRARFVIGAEEAVQEAGAVVWAPAGTPHGVSNDADAPLVLFVCMAPHPSFRPADRSGAGE